MLRNIFVASHVYEMSGEENKMKTVVYSTLNFITVRLECKKDVFFNNWRWYIQEKFQRNRISEVSMRWKGCYIYLSNVSFNRQNLKRITDLFLLLSGWYPADWPDRTQPSSELPDRQHAALHPLSHTYSGQRVHPLSHTYSGQRVHPLSHTYSG